MASWENLEQRFNELEPALKFSRIDGQTGAAGEHWRIAGPPSREAEARFNAVAAMASAKLTENLGETISQYPEVADEPDPTIRWYKAIKHIAGRWDHPAFARQLDDEGKSAGLILNGSIDNPAAASATFCLQLAVRFPEMAKSSAAESTSQPSWLEQHAVQIVVGVITTVIGGVILAWLL